jgi:hypothetical protein
MRQRDFLRAVEGYVSLSLHKKTLLNLHIHPNPLRQACKDVCRFGLDKDSGNWLWCYLTGLVCRQGLGVDNPRRQTLKVVLVLLKDIGSLDLVQLKKDRTLLGKYIPKPIAAQFFGKLVDLV